MSDDHDRFLVITGGPGSGKTTLIDYLSGIGFTTSGEAGRAVIRDQIAIDGPALPWRDPSLFAEMMLGFDLRAWRRSQDEAGPVIFDRGLPDVAGYLRLTGLAVPAHVDRAARAFRYNRKVFVAPPWREIFTQDSERRQMFEEAVRTCEAMLATYADYGYDTLMLPKASVEERAAFIIARAGLSAQVAG